MSDKSFIIFISLRPYKDQRIFWILIKSINNNFEASSNKLTYDKDAKTLKLIGNVFVKNLESEGLSIQESYGDELTIFTDSGLFKFNSENKNRVKTKLKF